MELDSSFEEVLSKRHKSTTDDWYVPCVVCACVNCTLLIL